MNPESKSPFIPCAFCSSAGEQACAEAWNLLLARDYGEPLLYWKFHRMAVDTYCLQHDHGIRTAKALAAHLCGLCIALEFENDNERLRQLQRWLSSRPDIQKPPLPAYRGDLSIRDVSNIQDPTAYGEAVQRWAQTTWDSYRDLHDLAREWLRMSLSLKSKILSSGK